jgi:hypothetical protein
MAIRLYLGSRKQVSLLNLSVYSVTVWLERIGCTRAALYRSEVKRLKTLDKKVFEMPE